MLHTLPTPQENLFTKKLPNPGSNCVYKPAHMKGPPLGGFFICAVERANCFARVRDLHHMGISIFLVRRLTRKIGQRRRHVAK